MKSPLRYPGGKSRAVGHILPLIPVKRSVASPFIGGGSIELALAERGQKVSGYDAFKPLVAFWQQALLEPNRMASEADAWRPITKSDFADLQRRLMGIEDPFNQAVAFFVINRASFSGATISGGMSPQQDRFAASAIQRLREFQEPNLRVERMDFTESMAKHRRSFLYLDPPYALDAGSRLYGDRGDMHADFPHERLRDELRKHKGGWLMSYNDCRTVRELYADCNIKSAAWTYGMNADKKASSEVLISPKEVQS